MKALLLVPLFCLSTIAWAQPAPKSSAPVPDEPTKRAPKDSAPVPDQAATPAPPRATVLVLPVISGGGRGWIAPWTGDAEAPRFAKLETEIAPALSQRGYVLVPLAEAAAKAGGAIRSLERPPTDEAAAEAARAAGATVAIVIQGEALRGFGDTNSKQAFTDALFEARAVRAADGVKLASAQTRASGYGAGEREADAGAIARAARRLFETMADALDEAVVRPVIAAHPFTLYIEGDLGWREYQRLRALLRHEVPEIRELEERRFAHGRQTLRVVCACEPWDITQRLDGRTAGGFALSAKSELTAVHVHARTLSRAAAAP